MDTIKLMREIEKRISKAEKYLPVVVERLQQQGELRLTYRIKDKEQILEKAMLFSKKSGFKGMDEFQILDSIGDIIALTVIVDHYMDSYEMLGKINDNFEINKQKIKVKRFADHISNGSITDYLCLLIQYDTEEGIPFEIQITDNENLKIREETHEEFKRIKYKQVRAESEKPNVSEKPKVENEGR